MPRKKRSRARKGSGSVRPYGVGQFRAEWRYTPPGRGQLRKTKILPTRDAAEAWLAKQRGQRVAAEGTLDDYLNRWRLGQEAAVMAGDLAAVTLKRYKQLLDNHVTPEFGRTLLRDVDADRTRGWLASLLRSRVPAGERKRVAVVMRKALNDAVKIGELPASPFPAVAIPRADAAESRALTVAEAKRLLEAAAELGHGALFRVWLDIGVRFTELAALTWSDYDRSAGVLHVRQAIDLSSKAIRRTKTEKSRRAIQLSEGARAAMASLPVGCPDDPLFPSPTGLHRRYRNFLRDVFYPVREAADLPWLVTKTARHSMATLALAAGEPLRVVSRRLGHKSVRTTEDIYGHSTAAEQERTAATLGGIFGPLPEVSSPPTIQDAGKGRGKKK